MENVIVDRIVVTQQHVDERAMVTEAHVQRRLTTRDIGRMIWVTTIGTIMVHKGGKNA